MIYEAFGRQKVDDSLTPVHVVIDFINSVGKLPNSVSQIAAYSLSVATAFVVGRLFKTISMRASESICFVDAIWKVRRQQAHYRKQKQNQKKQVNAVAPTPLPIPMPTTEERDWRFPYNATHRDQAYFSEICQIVEDFTGTSWDNLPSTQPIVGCYRILNAVSPELWDAVETREAESRLVGSLFLASVLSTFLGLAHIFFVRDYFWAIQWMVFSFGTCLLLTYAFRNVRKREVEYMYVDLLIAATVHRNSLSKTK